MQCPTCGTQQRYRVGMTCHECGYDYVISPKIRPYLSDRKVHTAIKHVSDDGARCFTVNQVIADMARRRKLRLGLRRASRKLTFGEAQRAIITYHAHTGRLPGLLTQPMLETDVPAPWPEPDLGDYGAERILVVDDRLVVDLLVRTWVHVNAHTVILSIDGYPAEARERARALVRERPEVPVVLLHGSAVVGPLAGMAVGRMLDAPNLPVRDLGLPPNAARNLKVLRWARRLPNVPVDCLPYRYLTAGLIGTLTASVALETAQAADDGGDGMLLAWLASSDDFG